MPSVTLQFLLLTSAIGSSNSPNLKQNITTLPKNDTNVFRVFLEPYKAYDPCIFVLLDSQNSTYTADSNAVISKEFQIALTMEAVGQTYSLDNPAQPSGGTFKASDFSSGGISSRERRVGSYAAIMALAFLVWIL